jgi:hypothetical protein
MTALPRTRLRPLLGPLCAGLLGGCAAIAPSSEEADRLAEPRTPPAAKLTSFSAALSCMDDLFARSGTPRRYITAISVPDQTGAGIGGGTLSMLISAISEMNRRSNAFQFVYLPVTFSGAIPNPETGRIDLGYLLAHIKVALGGKSSAIDLPDYLLVASVSEMNRAVSETKVGLGLQFGWGGFGLSGDNLVSVMTTDFNVADGRSFKILNGANATNSVALVSRGVGGDLDARLKTMGGYLTLSVDRSEGPHAALRVLIQLSAIETLGKLAGVPYQQCLAPRQIPAAAVVPATAPIPPTPATPARPNVSALALTSPSPRRYRVGDQFRFQARAGRAMDLFCYYRNAKGQLWQVLPTDFQPGTAVRAGGAVQVPDTPRYDLVFDTPGTERAMCLGLPPGSAARLAAALPAGTSRTDLKPLAAGSLEAIVDAFRAALGSTGELARADLQVQVE